MFVVSSIMPIMMAAMINKMVAISMVTVAAMIASETMVTDASVEASFVGVCCLRVVAVGDLWKMKPRYFRLRYLHLPDICQIKVVLSW